jgi:hypothetical protein
MTTLFKWTPKWRRAMQNSVETWKRRASTPLHEAVTCSSCALCVLSTGVSEEDFDLNLVNCNVCPIGTLGYQDCSGTPALSYSRAQGNWHEAAQKEVEFLQAVYNGTIKPLTIDNEE